MCISFPSASLWLYQNRSSLMLGASLPWNLVVGGEHFCIFVLLDRIYWLAVRALRALRWPHGTSATPPMAQDPISSPSAIVPCTSEMPQPCPAVGTVGPGLLMSLPDPDPCLCHIWCRGCPQLPQPAPLPHRGADTGPGWCWYTALLW